MLPAIQGTLYHPNHEYSDQKLSLLIYKPIVQSDILQIKEPMSSDCIGSPSPSMVLGNKYLSAQHQKDDQTSLGTLGLSNNHTQFNSSQVNPFQIVQKEKKIASDKSEMVQSPNFPRRTARNHDKRSKEKDVKGGLSNYTYQNIFETQQSNSKNGGMKSATASESFYEYPNQDYHQQSRNLSQPIQIEFAKKRATQPLQQVPPNKVQDRLNLTQHSLIR